MKLCKIRNRDEEPVYITNKDAYSGYPMFLFDKP